MKSPNNNWLFSFLIINLNLFLSYGYRQDGYHSSIEAAAWLCHYERSLGELRCTTTSNNDAIFSSQDTYTYSRNIWRENLTDLNIDFIRTVYIVNTMKNIGSRIDSTNNFIARYYERVENIILKNCSRQLISHFTNTIKNKTLSLKNLVSFSLENLNIGNTDDEYSPTHHRDESNVVVSFLLNTLAEAAPNLKYLSLLNADLSLNNNEEEEIREQNENMWEKPVKTKELLITDNLLNFSKFQRVTALDLTFNRLESLPEHLPPLIELLNISHNQISRFVETSAVHQYAPYLSVLDASFNKIETLLLSALFRRCPNLRNVSLAYNQIKTMDNGWITVNNGNNEDRRAPLSPNIENLQINDNLLEILDGRSIGSAMPALEILNVSGNPLRLISKFNEHQRLKILDFSRTRLEVLDTLIFDHLSPLKTLYLANCQKLRFFGGNLANMRSLRYLSFNNCSSLKHFPTNFFQHVKNPLKIDASFIEWPCDCRSSWISLIPPQVIFLNGLIDPICPQNWTDSIVKPRFHDCELGTVKINGSILRTTHGNELLMDCGLYGQPFPDARWFRVISVNDGPKLLENKGDNKQHKEKYTFYQDGSVRVNYVYRSDVGVYLCVYKNSHGNGSIYQRIRLDYASAWWLMKVYSVVCGILTAFAFFALNVIYGAIRRLIVWRVSKLQRTGRFRLLLESIEKYRSRQMVNLQDMYTSNIQQVRENYHQQVDTLRKSYAAQADRFRDYRTARMENVQHHVDAVRDNYNAQMTRLREYGGRQMERVWDSYQRRVTRLRDYTMQRRVRLMRQYKIKQRYFNKLMEGLNLENYTIGRHGTKMGDGVAPTAVPEFIEMQCMDGMGIDIDVEGADECLPGSSTSAFYFGSFGVVFNDSFSTTTGGKSESLGSLICYENNKNNDNGKNLPQEDEENSSYHSILEIDETTPPNHVTAAGMVPDGNPVINCEVVDNGDGVPAAESSVLSKQKTTRKRSYST